MCDFCDYQLPTEKDGVANLVVKMDPGTVFTFKTGENTTLHSE